MKITDFIACASQMDIENHRISYVFEKRITTEQYRKPELFISHKDFHCFELLGFPSDFFSPLYVSKQTLRKHLCKNTCISRNINISNEISTIRPFKITTKIHVCFPYLLKQHLSQNQQQIKEKPCIPKTSLLSTKYQHSDFPGPTQGRPQSTKTTPRAPQDPPETLRKHLV